MVKLLKSNNLANLVIMFIFMALLWAFKFIYMPNPTEPYEYDSYFFPSFPENIKWKYISALIAFVIYYIFSLFIIRSNINLSIVESANQSPGIFFVILTGMYINTQRLVPEIIAGMLIFIAIIIIFNSNKKYKALSNCFDAGLCFGFATLLVNEFVIFLIIILVALIYVRGFNWRDIVSLISGTLCILILICSLIYLYGDFDAFKNTLQYPFSRTYYGMRNIYKLYIFLPILILSGIAILSKFTLRASQNAFTRSTQNVLTIFVLFTIVYFASPFASNETIVILYAPLSLLLADLFMKIRNLASNILFWGLIACMMFLQIMQYKFYYF